MNYKCNLKRILLLLSTVFLLFPSFCFAIVDTSSLSIESSAAILIHADTGIVLYEKEANTKMYPASTTKIMTAILVLESGHDLSELATVSENAVMSVPAGYSRANLQPGEQFTLEQLLNVLLIPSANDAANVLAEYISGSVPLFAEAMNAKALELGCVNTHFVNPSGIHSDDHYSTAYDLSLIGRYAMQNETFRSFVCKTSCSLPATEKYTSEDRFFTTTNALLINHPEANHYYSPYAIGVKTGFTTPAGNCLVAASSHNGLEFISVILGGAKNEEEVSQRYSDTKKLFDFAYANYCISPLKTKNAIVKEIKVTGATPATQNLALLCDRDIFAFIPLQAVGTTISPEMALKGNLTAPIKKGDIVGSIKYIMMGIPYEANLIAGNDVEKEMISPLMIKIGMILTVCILVILCLFLIRRKTKFEEIDLFR